MRSAFEDAEIIGFEPMIELQTQCSDMNDRHVLAAAIVGEVDQLVTSNVRHFPAVIEPHSIEVVTPDEFLLYALDDCPRATTRALRNQVANLSRPHLSASQVLASLAKCGASGFAGKAEAMLNRL
jgi:hypothetical protein